MPRNKTLPRVEYFLYEHAQPISGDAEECRSPLPLSREASLQGSGFTIGDYFKAVHDFLIKDDQIALVSSVQAPVETVKIRLEKHGEFYHPSKVEAAGPGFRGVFAVNAAVSETGRQTIFREYDILKRLGHGFPLPFVPQVYHLGQGGQAPAIPMFIGEWFENYHEFHLSRNPLDGRMGMVLWDSQKGRVPLSPFYASEVYRQAALIMTCYYNIRTLERIFPWHHAAGDFILRIQHNKIDLKLITARKYEPLICADADDPETLLEALLIFLISLSIRTRLDRLDGVGDVAWADDMAVSPTLRGFFQGLDMNPQDLLPPSESLPSFFLKFMRRYSLSDLMEFARASAKTYPASSPEFTVVWQHLESHVSVLYELIAHWPDDFPVKGL
jgi:hypothetical protein